MSHLIYLHFSVGKTRNNNATYHVSILVLLFLICEFHKLFNLQYDFSLFEKNPVVLNDLQFPFRLNGRRSG